MPSSFSLSTEGKSINKCSTLLSFKKIAAASNKYGGFVFEYFADVLLSEFGKVLITIASTLLLFKAFSSCSLVIKNLHSLAL